MMDSRKAPLLFVLQDNNDPRRSQVDAKAIASHVSARYKPWRKTNRKSLALDSTTKAILTYKRPPDDNSLQKGTTQDPALGAIEGTVSIAAGQEKNSDSTMWDNLRRAEHPRLSVLGSSSFDPFTPTSQNINHEVKSNLHFYFKVIRPFALYLVQDWEWLDSLSMIQSSSALAHAVAAYASVFISGCMKGGPGIVLPPPASEGETPLWSIPPGSNYTQAAWLSSIRCWQIRKRSTNHVFKRSYSCSG